MLKHIVLAAILILFHHQAIAWGQTGHRVTGEIAEAYLSPQAAEAVANLLGSEDLAEASTWADEMRSNPSEFWQKTASPWHYVNVQLGEAYKTAPPEGDAVSALGSILPYDQGSKHLEGE